MPESANLRGYILAFDFGLRRIGIAVGQFTTMTASSLETVGHGKTPDWVAIDRVVGEWKPARLLVGLPLATDGQETKMSRSARKFGRQLNGRYQLEVSFADERFSSRAAEGEFAEQRARGAVRRKHARQLDAVAARIILENWLQTFDLKNSGEEA
jgi:putative Holliday junction resolvase